MKSPLFYECGSCGHFHKPLLPRPSLAAALYVSDCRYDANRFDGDHPEVVAAESADRIEYLDDAVEFLANFN